MKICNKWKYINFALWVANMIFVDDEEWELNASVFPELACRKLAKLGIVRIDGNNYIFRR